MGSLIFWSMIIILYQTVLTVIFSWLVLACKLQPKETEFRELTLLKLLYLHDPVACGRIFFYNYTDSNTQSWIVWPERNEIAEKFRLKIRVYLTLHVLWAGLGLVYATQSRQPYGLYTTLLPFTLSGLALLVTDVIYAVLFLLDLKYTQTEAQILDYINKNGNDVRMLIKRRRVTISSLLTVEPKVPEDTSWICLMFAYISIRAIVQWVVNLWIVKDNYSEGMEYRRSLQDLRKKRSANAI